MIEYRRARPEERDAYLALADSVFRDAGTDIHFAQAIPKVYGPDMDTAHMQHVAVDSERGMVGLVAVMPGELHVLDRVLKIGYVGTVCVRPDARGEGHMKALMAQALDDMRAQGMDIAMLGGQRQRYEYFGFAKGGLMLHARVNRSNVRHALADVDADDVTFAELLSGTPEEQVCAAMHSRRRYWFDRSQPGFAVICRSYDFTPWVFRRGGRIIGWCVADEDGQHFAELYAPYAGRDIPAMVKAWMAHHGGWEVRIDVPQSDREIVDVLNGWAESITCGPAVSVRILNYPRVVEAMLRLKANYTYLEEGEASFRCEGQTFTVGVEGDEVTVVPGADADTDVLEMSPDVPSRFWTQTWGQERPFGWLPLPLCAPEPDAF